MTSPPNPAGQRTRSHCTGSLVNWLIGVLSPVSREGFYRGCCIGNTIRTLYMCTSCRRVMKCCELGLNPAERLGAYLKRRITLPTVHSGPRHPATEEHGSSRLQPGCVNAQSVFRNMYHCVSDKILNQTLNMRYGIRSHTMPIRTNNCFTVIW